MTMFYKSLIKKNLNFYYLKKLRLYLAEIFVYNFAENDKYYL